MIYIGLRDYQHFKELFGKRETSGGALVRQNRILLAYYRHAIKNHTIMTEAKEVTNMNDLYQKVMERLNASENEASIVLADGNRFQSSQMATDSAHGLCVDGDPTSIRYINLKDNRVYKMKGGKFLRRVAIDSKYGRTLPDSTLNHVVEIFSQKWSGFAAGKVADYTLVVDDDFQSIYSSGNYAGDFHSCMAGCDYYSFYNDSVKALAASIWKNDRMYARCVIFTDVKDKDTGESFRLAERQYSVDQNDLYKNILVNLLIQNGYIDGYKKIGAGCHDAKLFVDNRGESLAHRNLYIDCRLGLDDYVCYQDSFKYFDDNLGVAYNTYKYGYSYDLSVTDGYLESEYDDYHGYRCNTTECVQVWSEMRQRWEEYRCDVENMNDFTRCSDGYYYDCVEWVESIGEYVPFNTAIYSDLTGDYILLDDAVWSKYHDSYLYIHDSVFCEISDDYYDSEDSRAEWLVENDYEYVDGKWVEKEVA